MAIAASVGSYSEQAPPAALASHFRCTWSHHLPADFDNVVVVVPDGCSDILWSSRGLFVAGPDRTAAFPPLQAGETVVGFRFQPGAAARWLNLSIAEITGETVALSDLWGADGRELHERLSETGSTAEGLALLQDFLTQRAAQATTPSDDMHHAFEHLSRKGRERPQTVEALARALGYGERTLRRRCLDHFGYGPKTLGRILRFQRFLSLLKANQWQPMSILALEAGYADQAHMCREVQALAGLPPAEIRQQLVA